MNTLSTEASETTDASGSAPLVATRDRIVAAALEVFIEKGYSGTRVQDIAERAGLTGGALYVHFPNRSKLLAEAISVEGGRIISGLIEYLQGFQPGEGRISSVLTGQMVAESELIDRLLVEAFALASRDEESRDLMDATLRLLDEFLSEKVREAIEVGALDPELSAEAVSAVFSSWIMGMIVHRAISRPRPDQDEMQEVVSRMLSGLTPRDH